MPHLLLALLLGCNNNRTPLPIVDLDEDGHYSDVDCNDEDPLINPAAQELCDGIDNDCDGESDEDDAVEAQLWFPDSDGDGYGTSLAPVGGCEGPEGYVSNSGDCDDSDPTRSPGNIELCDGFDNDCDELIDEDSAADVVTVYRDSDGDGYGNPYITSSQCYADDDHLLNSDDCDDSDATINPDGVEICDEQDNDCDGLVDDDDDDLEDGLEWFGDSDGDGYGDIERLSIACLQPEGSVSSSEDCDDDEITINPEATERCGDAVDNDCDGAVDVDDADAQPVSWYTDADGDGFGDPDQYWGEGCAVPSGLVANNDDCDDGEAAISPAQPEVWYDGVDADCAGDDDYDADADGDRADAFDGADCDDTDPEVSSLALEVCGDGLDNDCDTRTDPCALTITFTGELDSDEAGASLLAAGDLDGDGVADLLLGAPEHDSAGAGAGAIYLVAGPISGDVALADAVRVDGEGVNDAAGTALAAPGDVDGDGYDDVLLSGYRADSSASEVGGAYLLAGPLTAGSAADAAARFMGEAAGDAAGWSLSSGGDFDGDGDIDLLLGAVDEASIGTGGGAAYLLTGPLTADTRLWSAQLKLTAEAAGDAVGTAAVFAGDLDGDGIDALAIGAPSHDAGGGHEGAVYLVSGPDEGELSLGDAAGMWAGEAGGDQAGWSLAALGDVDGDGRDDLLIGAPGADESGDESGAVYLVLGPATGSHELSEAAARRDGVGSEDFAGRAVSGAGDVDGDGTIDLAIGAPGEDTGGSAAGAVYLVLGPISGTASLSSSAAVVWGAAEDAQLGAALTGAGDIDGDGQDDVLVGSPGASTAGLLTGGGW